MIILLTEDSGCCQLALHPPHTSEWNYLKIQNTGNVTIELVVGFVFFSFVCVKKKKKILMSPHLKGWILLWALHCDKDMDQETGLSSKGPGILCMWKGWESCNCSKNCSENAQGDTFNTYKYLTGDTQAFPASVCWQDRKQQAKE